MSLFYFFSRFAALFGTGFDEKVPNPPPGGQEIKTKKSFPPQASCAPPEKYQDRPLTTVRIGQYFVGPALFSYL
ncbi:hypothetical protein [Cyclobacterium plantarum]|uniref:hypothetical protein n=1 Tax=Cyclobacterium plantarum TaxID=2716263 RepID=UPI003F6EEBE5